MQNGEGHGDEGAYGHGDAGSHVLTGREGRGFKDKFVIPLLIPVGCGIVIAAVVLSLSQVLLAVPEDATTPIALVVALIILFGCTYFATARHVTRQTVYAGLAVPAVILVSAGVFSAVYRQNNPKAEVTGGEQANAAATGGGNVAAQPAAETTTDNKFSVTAYTVEANKPTTIAVQNKGAALHNMHILDVKDANGQDIKTDLLQPGQSANLTFTIGEAGSYNFQCDVHPTEMKGTITVTPANSAATAATAAAGPAAAGGLSEITTDDKFSQTSLSADKGVSVGMTVQNKGAALHNWHVLNVKGSKGEDIKTELVPGGQSSTITFQIDTPGTYDFQCDVHPTEMKGKLTIK